MQPSANSSVANAATTKKSMAYPKPSTNAAVSFAAKKQGNGAHSLAPNPVAANNYKDGDKNTVSFTQTNPINSPSPLIRARLTYHITLAQLTHSLLEWLSAVDPLPPSIRFQMAAIRLRLPAVDMTAPLETTDLGVTPATLTNYELELSIDVADLLISIDAYDLPLTQPNDVYTSLINLLVDAGVLEA